MTEMSMTAIIDAGNLAESDDFIPFIYGLTLKQAEDVARFMSLATKGDVRMRLIDFDTDEEIAVKYVEELERLNRTREGAGTGTVPGVSAMNCF